MATRSRVVLSVIRSPTVVPSGWRRALLQRPAVPQRLEVAVPAGATGRKRRRDPMGIADKGKDFLGGEKGEQVSDDALEKGSDLASEKTGGKHDDKLDKGADAADKRLGNE